MHAQYTGLCNKSNCARFPGNVSQEDGGNKRCWACTDYTNSASRVDLNIDGSYRSASITFSWIVWAYRTLIRRKRWTGSSIPLLARQIFGFYVNSGYWQL